MKMKVTVNPENKHDLDYYIGRRVICKVIITDIKGDRYSSEIILPADWSYEMFSEALKNSFLLCDNTPKETYIDYIGPDLEIMN